MTYPARNPKSTWKGDGKSGGSYTGGPAKALLHATITPSDVLPGYNSGYYAPHETWLWDVTKQVGRGVQHTEYTTAARALANLEGGVQTNRDSVAQIELAGYLDDGFSSDYVAGEFDILTAPTTYWEQLADWWGPVVRDTVKNAYYDKPWIEANRMSLSVWDNFGGLCSHINAAENNHRDLPLSQVIVADLAKRIWTDATPVVPTPIVVTKTTVAPTFPLPTGHYFYFPSPWSYVHSGYFSSVDRYNLRRWQGRMRDRGWNLLVDGLYGGQTYDVTRAFQREKGLTVDGKIGKNTWAAAWIAPIT